MNPRHHKILLGITLVALLICTVNLSWIIYQEGSSPHVVEMPNGGMMYISYSYVLTHKRMAVELALIISFVALAIRRLPGVFVSTLALMFGVVIYVSWLQYSVTLVRNANDLTFSEIEHIAYLYLANWWDISVLLMIIVLFIWELKISFSEILNYRRAESIYR
jgi:hypothetical protein